jgi:uncharacterized membrane protein YdjX (TVP38/TMEM64 family)
MEWPAEPSGELKITSFLTLDGVKGVGDLLQQLTDLNYYPMMLAHASCFLFLQSTAIPGTIFFNLLGGALFKMHIGYPICLVLNTVGSVCLYMLSHYFGRHIVQRFFQHRMDQFKELTVAKNDNTALFIFMVSLRVFPFTPNWFCNVASAQLGINVWMFALSVFIGLAPYNYFTCKAGIVLQQLSSRSDIIDRNTTIQLVTLSAILFLVPFIKKKYDERKADTTKKSA